MLSLYCIPGIVRQLTRLFVRCLGYNIRCKNSLTCQSKKENALSTKSRLCQALIFPDITGKYSTADRGTHANAEGAIQSILTENTARFCSQVQVIPPSNGFTFSARLSNAIYSNFTVQPPSFQIFMIVKA